jgi:hypothetical protein
MQKIIVRIKLSHIERTIYVKFLFIFKIDKMFLSEDEKVLVLKELDIKSLCNSFCINRSFKSFSLNETLWSYMYEKDILKLNGCASTFKKYMNNISWKDLYYYAYLISYTKFIKLDCDLDPQTLYKQDQEFSSNDPNYFIKNLKETLREPFFGLKLGNNALISRYKSISLKKYMIIRGRLQCYNPITDYEDKLQSFLHENPSVLVESLKDGLKISVYMTNFNVWAETYYKENNSYELKLIANFEDPD